MNNEVEKIISEINRELNFVSRFQEETKELIQKDVAINFGKITDILSHAQVSLIYVGELVKKILDESNACENCKNLILQANDSSHEIGGDL